MSMNDTMSLLLVSTILGSVGLGLFMFKTDDENKELNEEKNINDEADEKYNENKLFSSSFWGFSNEETEKKNEEKESIENEDDKNEKNEKNVKEDKEDKNKKNRNIRTKRNKKQIGTKRRYY